MIDQEWDRDMDENLFCSINGSGCQLLQREMGIKFHPINTKHKQSFAGLAVLLWVSIMLNGILEHHIFYEHTCDP